MKILPIASIAHVSRKVQNTVKNNSVSFGEKNDSTKEKKDVVKRNDDLKIISGMNGDKLKYFDSKSLFDITNISDMKVGSKYLLHPRDEKFQDLTILFTPDSHMEPATGLESMNFSKAPSFTGKVFGSIRKDDTEDTTMMKSYSDFWDKGMLKVLTNYVDRVETMGIKDDYNFFVPTDGDGTRFKDITKLQGNVTKPAADIPAKINGAQVKLVQVVLSNFAKTGKVTDGYEFIKVKPAQGSAYAFFEGLKDGRIPTDKPLVFSWGDNFADINISKLIKEHEKNNAGLTMLTLPVDSERIRSLGAAKVKGTDNLEVTDFYEKPKTDELVKEYIIPGTKDECLAVVGPYVISSETLAWLKDNYTKHPEEFLDKEGKVDFSRTILGKFVKGLITDSNGEKLKLFAYKKPETDTWSDLGTQKDFSKEMNNVKDGKYAGFPQEMKNDIINNIDKDGNITFNERAKTLFQQFCKEKNLKFENVLVYAKEQ